MSGPAALRTMASGSLLQRCSCGAIVRPSASSSSASSSSVRSLLQASRSRHASTSTAPSLSAPAIASYATKSKASAKARAKEKEQRDDRLRKCIDLYHLSSTFLPSRATASAMRASKFGKGKSQQQQVPASASEALDEELEQRIRSELSVGTSLAIQTGASTPAFRTGTDLVQQASNLERPSMTLLLHNSSSSDANAGRAGANAVRALGALAGSSASGGGASADELKDPMAQARLRRLSFRVKSDGSRPMLGRGSSMLGADGISQRDVLVRDALFGTVGVELPGLEVVRERVRAKQRREKQQSSSIQ